VAELSKKEKNEKGQSKDKMLCLFLITIIFPYLFLILTLNVVLGGIQMDTNDKSSTENEDLKNDEMHNQRESPPESEASTLSDLLHAIGLKKNKTKSANPTKLNAFDAKKPEISASNTECDFEEPQSANTIEDHLAKEYESDFSEENVLLPNPNKKKRRTPLIVFTIIALVSVGVFRFFPFLFEPKPPSPDVVATYNGKNITIEELTSFIETEGLKEREHMLCPSHGYDHSKCDPSEECESHPIDSLQGYQQMVSRMSMEQIIKDWADAQGITNREEVKHGMKDLLNDVTVEQYVSQLHNDNVTADSVTKWEIQQYYSDNMEKFQGKSLADVEEKIKETLAAQKEENFFPAFIEELKKTAGLQVDFEVLKVAAPSEEEIAIYYNNNKKEFQIPASISFEEILIPADRADKATEAIRKIRSGESFVSVATVYSQGGKAESRTAEKGSLSEPMETTLWKMNVGDVSDPITNDDGTVSIVKPTKTAKPSLTPLSAARKEIESKLLRKIIDTEYNQRKNDTLFSIHSRRYTLGEFYTEFKELSPIYQDALATYEAKKSLVEQIISKELLLENSSDGSDSSDESHKMEELQIQYLSQVMHEEEVDVNLAEPTEEEISTFYKENQEELREPSTVELNLIWIDQGVGGEKAQQAKVKADEALASLNSGTSFEEVAKKYSEDASAANGGKIEGDLHEEYLAPVISKSAFSLKIGDVSPVLDYDNGYYIIQVRNRTEATIPTLEEASEEIKSHLQDLAHEKSTYQMQEKMLTNANFKVYNRTLRNMMKAVDVTGGGKLKSEQ